MENQKIKLLRGFVQKYDWGKLGSDSLVARFYSNSFSPAHFIDENKTYAELWFGTHPNGPTSIISNSGDDELLSSNIPSLPFLLKILSVGKSLSLQAHPDKILASHLFKTKNYPDSNHKPEMVIALSTFHMLCHFRDYNQIVSALDENSELVEIISLETVNNFKKDHQLKPLFTSLMTCNKEKLKINISKFIQRISSDSSIDLIKKLILRLHAEHPFDVGIFSPLLLNYLILNPGESMFLGPNIPHAYLYGDCIEAMANSDNVVRAGLTHKFIDVETLCSMLTYEMITPSLNNGSGIINDEMKMILFNPPPSYPEFSLKYVSLAHRKNIKISTIHNSILLVVEGVAELIDSSNNRMTLNLGVSLLLTSTEITISTEESNFKCIICFKENKL